MTERITADQFNAHGKTIRRVEIQVNMPSSGKAVHLSVTPEVGGRLLSYSITREDWNKLCAVQPHQLARPRGPHHPKPCVCGYPAEDGQDLDEHILGMASGGSEPGSHREAR